MKPVSFPEANFELSPPEGMENCEPLRAYRETGLIVSCWQLSWRERLSALFFGKAWLHVAANYHPPVAIAAERNPFKPRHAEAE